MKTFTVASFLILLLFNVANAQTKRTAIKGFQFSNNQESNGITITEVQEGSPIQRSGLKKGDVVTSVNGKPLSDYEVISRILSQLPSGSNITFDVKRKTDSLKINVVLTPRPKEEYRDTNVEYSGFIQDNNFIRTITTRPKTPKKDQLPAVFLVQWLSCATIDIPGKPTDGMEYIIKSFAKNPDIIFHRVEKSGVGDSRGTSCLDLNAEDEIQAYKMGLEQLKSMPDVDSTQIYIIGLSLGGSLAPIVSSGQDVAGYIVSGATTKTWFEHMLDFERKRLQLSGEAPSKVNSQMALFSKFYSEYLLTRKTPNQVIKSNQIFNSIWYDMPRHQFGRSARYYHQIQELDLEGKWSEVKVPTKVLYGEYDWVMTIEDHRNIVEIVNKNGENLAEMSILARTDHLLNLYASQTDAFNEVNGSINEEAFVMIWQWLNSQFHK